MEAVRLQNSVQVKRAATRTTATDTKTAGGDFVKLLKEKKDLAEPQQPKAEQTEGKKDQSQPVKNETSDKAGEKPVKTEEGVPAQDPAEQDVLLQTVLLQAAVQMTVLPQVQEPVQEAAPQLAETAGVIAPDALPVGGEAPVQEIGLQSDVGAVQRPVEPVSRQKGQEEEASLKEDGRQTGESEAPLRETAPERKPEESHEVSAHSVKREQVSVQKEEPAGQKTAVEEAAYTAHEVRGHQEPAGPQHKLEPIPLKTSEASLPQDLGRTLAAKLPGAGQELTVELEPANLGKLTIKLVYEGERAAVSIMASNPKTLELLSQKAGEIASILEEKTGQETIIYTQPSSQERDDTDPNQSHGGRQDQGERREHREEDRHQTESFAQQLRLGLV